MDDERVEVVSEAAGGGLVAGVVELADQDLQAQGAVLDAGRLVQRPPVREPNAFSF